MEAILHHFSSVLSLEGLIETWLPTVLGLALVSSLEELVLRGHGLHAAGLVNAAANGILLAWLVMRTGSLWMACAYHASWNITGP